MKQRRSVPFSPPQISDPIGLATGASKNGEKFSPPKLLAYNLVTCCTQTTKFSSLTLLICSL